MIKNYVKTPTVLIDFAELTYINFSGTLYWSELRFDEGGRYVVCSQKSGEDKITEWCPYKDSNLGKYNARTRVHEYGGGAFFVYGGHIYFSNFSDQRMYVQKAPGADPQAITPEDSHWRYADGHFNGTVSTT